MAERLSVDSRSPAPEAIARAIETLRRGELVVIPTETVYGLAADATQPAAIERIYAAKSRDGKKPLAFFVRRTEDMEALGAELSPAARRLAQRGWPGPLTLVLPAGEALLGFRIPDHPVALAVVEAMGGPLAVTSANLSGEPDARTAGEAEHALGEAVALVLDAGPSPGGVPSTVVRCVGDQLEILRAGALDETTVRTMAETETSE